MLMMMVLQLLELNEGDQLFLETVRFDGYAGHLTFCVHLLSADHDYDYDYHYD